MVEASRMCTYRFLLGSSGCYGRVRDPIRSMAKYTKAPAARPAKHTSTMIVLRLSLVDTGCALGGFPGSILSGNVICAGSWVRSLMRYSMPFRGGSFVKRASPVTTPGRVYLLKVIFVGTTP